MPTGAVLAVLPLVLLAVAIYFRSATGDFSGDPDYAYLLNALKISQLRPPNHVDHPGTTVQIVAGFIVRVCWLARLPFNGRISAVDDVLLHPEWYLGGIRLAFSALTCGALFALGWRIFHATGSLAASLVAQVSVSFSYPTMFFGLTEVGPEGLLLPLTLFLAAAIVPAAFASDSRSASDPSLSSRTGAIVGVLIGACLMTKTNARPLDLHHLRIPRTEGSDRGGGIGRAGCHRDYPACGLTIRNHYPLQFTDADPCRAMGHR
jgi:hypothetical protein